MTMSRIPDETITLSVVIPCLDVEELLPTQLEALSRQECSVSWEVIVADNGSTDRTRQVAEQFRDRLPSLTIVDASPRGRHHACNAGAAQARGENLVFVDADDEVAAGFLEAMAKGLRRAPFVGGRLDHGRFNVSKSATVGNVQTKGLMDGFGFLPYASGGCLAVYRDVFVLIGGFAEDMPFCEDVDFSWRSQLEGFQILFVPEAVVSVRQRASLRQMYMQHRNFGAGQALLFREYRKHGMPRRMLLDVLRDWWAIVKGLPRLRTRDQKERWCRRAGRASGRLLGSMKYRVFYP